MVFMTPDKCNICNDTLLGPPPPNALVLIETDVHQNVKAYHKSCVERLARIAQLLNDKGEFYGTSTRAGSSAMKGDKTPSKSQLRYNDVASSDDDTHDVRDKHDKTMQTGYLRTPYTNETFDDQRDKVIAELRLQLDALSKRIEDGPSYVAQAVRKSLQQAMIEYRSGIHVFDEMRGEWVTRGS